ncbi:MAG: Flp pilus assembly complex ATPase component [Euryarchaeota archaeon]|nr:Flp pilus assembly complex ATPase component [Euryarchaeota archaeon]
MMILVPDTSVIVDGRITRLVQERPGVRVVIAEAVVAELEHQANQGRESGYRGLEELITLRQLHKDGVIELEFHGARPHEREFYAIDDIIRRTAAELGGTLVTSDRIQAMVAEAKGIEVLYLRKEESRRMPRILEYFDDSTMSVHLRERVPPMAKKGTPGNMRLVPLGEKPMEEPELQQLAKEIVEFARMDRDSFIEIERRGATVVQMREVRIAIAKPPFSDAFEITAVRAIAKVSLEDYRLSEKLIERLRSSAEGILVAGPPGAGKSTFSQALAEFYASLGKIVKTMESPRDLQVGQEISQYAPLEGDMEKTADILLLVRPDRTIYDEVRKTKDFRIFADMRLAGVGMVGVVHATKAIDALQRLIGRVELGMIPQIVDTVIFIKDGRVEKVYRIDFSVKVPHGMAEADLARPVIEVRDFESGEVEYEIYTFGDETVVMPIKGEAPKSAASKLAEEAVLREVRRRLPASARVNVRVDGNRAVVQVDERHLPSLIGRKGRKIAKLEKKLGLRIDVRTLGSSEEPEGERLSVEVRETKQYLHLVLGREHAGRMVKFYAGDEYLFVATIGRKGEVKLAKNTEIAETLLRHLDAGEELTAVAVE